MNVRQARAQLRTVNDRLGEIPLQLPWNQRRGVRNRIQNVNGILNNFLERYGRTNQRFLEPFRQAQEIYGTVERSNYIANWISRRLPGIIRNPGLNVLLGGSAVYHGVGKTVAGIFSKVPGAMVGAAAHESARIIYRIARSPNLRRLYGRILRQASLENSAGFTKLVSQLDRELEKEEENEQKSNWKIVKK